MNKHIFNRAMLGYEFVLFSGFFSIIYFVTVDEDIVYKQVYTIMSLVLLIIMLIGYGIWMKWEMFGRCNFESRRLLAEIFKGKGIRSIKNKLLLLSLYILLGYEDKCQKIMDELNDLYSEMPEDLKLKFQIRKLYFQIDVDGYEETREKIKELVPFVRDLDKSSNDYIAVMFADCYSDKNWNKALEVLENKEIKNVYDQVWIAFFRGKCYFQLKEYQQAFYNLEITRRFGGNTKYVSLAKNMIEQLPVGTKGDVNTYKRDSYYFHEMYKMIACVVGICCVIAVSVLSNKAASYGNSFQEIYAKRHLSSESEVDILYQGKVAEYDLIMVNYKNYIDYCFFQKVDGKKNASYKMIYQVKVDKGQNDSYNKQNKEQENQPYINKILGYIYGEDFKDSYNKQNKEQENQLYIVRILDYIYGKKFFEKKGITYIGAAFDKSTSNITIEGKPLKIKKEIQNGEETIYIWEISDINIEDVLFNISYQEDAE